MKTHSVRDKLSYANRRTNVRTKMTKQIAFCFAEGLKNTSFGNWKSYHPLTKQWGGIHLNGQSIKSGD